MADPTTAPPSIGSDSRSAVTTALVRQQPSRRGLPQDSAAPPLLPSCPGASPSKAQLFLGCPSSPTTAGQRAKAQQIQRQRQQQIWTAPLSRSVQHLRRAPDPFHGDSATPPTDQSSSPADPDSNQQPVASFNSDSAAESRSGQQQIHVRTSSGEQPVLLIHAKPSSETSTVTFSSVLATPYAVRWRETAPQRPWQRLARRRAQQIQIQASSTSSGRAAIPGPSGERETSRLQPGLPQDPGYRPM